MCSLSFYAASVPRLYLLLLHSLAGPRHPPTNLTPAAHTSSRVGVRDDLSRLLEFNDEMKRSQVQANWERRRLEEEATARNIHERRSDDLYNKCMDASGLRQALSSSW